MNPWITLIICAVIFKAWAEEHLCKIPLLCRGITAYCTINGDGSSTTTLFVPKVDISLIPMNSDNSMCVPIEVAGKIICSTPHPMQHSTYLTFPGCTADQRLPVTITMVEGGKLRNESSDKIHLKVEYIMKDANPSLDLDWRHDIVSPPFGSLVAKDLSLATKIDGSMLNDHEESDDNDNNNYDDHDSYPYEVYAGSTIVTNATSIKEVRRYTALHVIGVIEEELPLDMEVLDSSDIEPASWFIHLTPVRELVQSVTTTTTTYPPQQAQTQIEIEEEEKVDEGPDRTVAWVSEETVTVLLEERGFTNFGYLEFVLNEADIARERRFSPIDGGTSSSSSNGRNVNNRTKPLHASSSNNNNNRDKNENSSMKKPSKDVNICIWSSNVMDGQKSIWLQQVEHLRSSFIPPPPTDSATTDSTAVDSEEEVFFKFTWLLTLTNGETLADPSVRQRLASPSEGENTVYRMLSRIIQQEKEEEKNKEEGRRDQRRDGEPPTSGSMNHRDYKKSEEHDSDDDDDDDDDATINNASGSSDGSSNQRYHHTTRTNVKNQHEQDRDIDRIRILDSPFNGMALDPQVLAEDPGDGRPPASELWEKSNFDVKEIYRYTHESLERANYQVENITPAWCRQFYLRLQQTLPALGCSVIVYGNDRGFTSDVLVVHAARMLGIPTVAELVNLFMHPDIIPDVIVAPSHYAMEHESIQTALRSHRPYHSHHPPTHSNTPPPPPSIVDEGDDDSYEHQPHRSVAGEEQGQQQREGRETDPREGSAIEGAGRTARHPIAVVISPSVDTQRFDAALYDAPKQEEQEKQQHPPPSSSASSSTSSTSTSAEAVLAATGTATVIGKNPRASPTRSSSPAVYHHPKCKELFSTETSKALGRKKANALMKKLGRDGMLVGGAPCVVIGFLARLSPGKSPGLFLQAAHEILALYPFARFTIIGDGELRSSLEDLTMRLQLTHMVHFAGWISESLPQLLAGIDIVINPTLRGWSETFCIANIEVMSMSIPLVTFAVGGIGEYVSAPVERHSADTNASIPDYTVSSNAVIVNRATPMAIARAVYYLITHPTEREVIGITGRQTVVSYFHLDRQMQQYADLYTSLLNRKRN